MSERYTALLSEPRSADVLESQRLAETDALEKETLLPSRSLERADYDVPPPGSPPATGTYREFGNSNGFAPGEPERPTEPRRSILQRFMSNIFPSRYQRVPSDDSAPAVGGGSANDGVFANMSARPQKNVAVTAEDGSVHMVPEDAQDVLPPSYAVAQRDRVPEYGASPIVADPNAEILFDDLPAGPWVMFICSAFISFFFHIIGFIVAYVSHTAHAQKYGAYLGLGMTLIQFGLVSLTHPAEMVPIQEVTFYNNGTANFVDNLNTTTSAITPEALEEITANYASYASTHEFVSIFIMMFGTMLVCHALYSFWRIKFLEGAMKSAAELPPTDEEVQRNHAAISAAFDLFGRAPDALVDEERGESRLTPQEVEADARLRLNLENAGLI